MTDICCIFIAGRFENSRLGLGLTAHVYYSHCSLLLLTVLLLSVIGVPFDQSL